MTEERDLQPTMEWRSGYKPGEKISGRYLIEESIGRGSFGEVYRAQDEMLQRVVALKTIIMEKSASPEERDRFLEEARTVAKLDHPHIIPIYDVGFDGATPWMAIRLVKGESLAGILSREGALKSARIIDLLKQAAKSLDHAHRKGIIHRDVKPANILIEMKEDGTEHVWLTDFGIAKILSGKTTTQETTIAGTPSYMAPEQVTGKRVDARTDLFALGSVAYECTTGKRAFLGNTLPQVVYGIVHQQPEGFNEIEALAGKAFGQMVRRALAKSPEDRYQTAEEMASDLDRLGRGETLQTRKSGWPVIAAFLKKRAVAPWDGKHPLVVEELYKEYRFRKPVVNGINLKVPTGSIYALLGRNGSGKTTLIRTMLGIYKKDAGRVSIFGRDPDRDGPSILSRLGYVPETLAAYETMKTGEFLQFLSAFYPKWDHALSYQLLGRYELPLETKIKDLSKGMKTKVSLVAALSHRPEFLVLDDPTLGLDAVILEEFFETLQEVSQKEGTTVFVASHNIEELEKISSHVGFIKDGRMLMSDTLASLRMRTREVKLTFKDDAPDVHIDSFKTVRASGRRLTGFVLDTSSGALDKLKALGAEQIEVRELSLKEIFVNFMR